MDEKDDLPGDATVSVEESPPAENFEARSGDGWIRTVQMEKIKIQDLKAQD